jgi:hypothetical protein
MEHRHSRQGGHIAAGQSGFEPHSPRQPTPTTDCVDQPSRDWELEIHPGISDISRARWRRVRAEFFLRQALPTFRKSAIGDAEGMIRFGGLDRKSLIGIVT